MLNWFSRLRKPVDRVHGVAARPFHILHSRHARLAPRLWQSPYCCTMAYFWVAVVTEELCRGRYSERDKHKVLHRAFARIVKEMRGSPSLARQQVLPDGHPLRLRALGDLTRAVGLFRQGKNPRLMIYADYRAAVDAHGRPAVPGNRWGLRTEAAHEILLAGYLAGNVRPGRETR